METVPFGNQNYVLHASATQHYWRGAGLLSIKTFTGGQALYEGDGHGLHLVDDYSYLILNHGQSYSITIDAKRHVESFCIFFAAGMAEDVYRTMTERGEHLLDDPWKTAPAQVRFFERIYPHDDVLSPALRRLRAYHTLGHTEAGILIETLTEQLHDLMRALLRRHRGVVDEIESLPAARAATREELYRRLYRARDFIHAAYYTPMNLDDMARVACMSPHHFLRMFKLAFRETPHQYLTSIRLQHAQQLLLHTDCPVTEVCFAVGFDSLGSFSWLFRRRVGIPPQAYRLRKSQF